MLELHNPSLLQGSCWLGAQAPGSVATFAVTDPASGAVIAHVAKGTAAHARAAIEAASAAWPAWRSHPAQHRASLLMRWHALILENADDLARIITAEQGKPLTEARGEVAYAASFIAWFAEEAKRIYGETIPAPSASQRIVVIREPIGVCAAITPWNFPAAMITRKAAPALAAGCTMVLKPASQTPLTALALCALAVRAGIPADVLSVVTGAAGDIGTELACNPLVRKLSFTGSTEVGRLLMQQTAATVKKVSMELGGNAPFIVFEDADLDAAVEGAILSKFRNAGQTCVCTNRLYVHTSVYEAFAYKLTAALQLLKIGPGDGADVRIGPLIDEAAVRKVEAHLADALQHGARVLCGGRRHALGGHFFEPTVLVDATQQMQLAHEETFGPLAALFRFDDEDDVVAKANDTEFGLASYFYARDIGRVWRVAERLQFGMVGVNTGAISNEMAPFGGIKQSGFGREGSRHGIEDYLVVKYINMGGIA